MSQDARRAKQRVLIASEKPFAATHTVAAWRRAHPDDDITIVYLPPMGALSLDIPRDLPISQVPRIAEPQYAPNFYGSNMTRVPQGCHYAPNLGSAVQNVDIIVCATDPDPAGTFNFANSMRYAGIDLADSVLWFPVTATDGAVLDDELKSGKSVMHPNFSAMQKHGEARRFFDYNFAINALPCYSHIFRRAGLPLKVNFLSKYALQLTFHLVKNDEEYTKDNIHKLMKYWPGSGKYPDQQIGSPISRDQILQDLIAAQILTHVSGGYDGKREVYRVSNLAKNLVASLHKGMCDPDLPARLDNWGATWPDSRASIETYIRTVFGQQRRALKA